MTMINCYMGEVTHHLKGGRVRTFSPDGPTFVVTQGVLTKLNPIARLGQGGLSARIFVGLKVGTRVKWKVADVVKIVWEVREKQKQSPDASILAQSGIYKDHKGRRIVEPSVQIIIMDFAGSSKETFLKEMEALAESLREKLQQETVILEIQNRGIIEDVYSVTG
jgi:hypothetical protein